MEAEGVELATIRKRGARRWDGPRMRTAEQDALRTLWWAGCRDPMKDATDRTREVLGCAKTVLLRSDRLAEVERHAESGPHHDAGASACLTSGFSGTQA